MFYYTSPTPPKLVYRTGRLKTLGQAYGARVISQALAGLWGLWPQAQHRLEGVRGPLTSALAIAASDRSHAQGTMDLYFGEGGNSDKGLGLTCRHVLLKTDTKINNDYVFAGSSASRKFVQLLGTRAFNKLLNSIKLRIGCHGIMVEIHEGQIKRLEKGWAVTMRSEAKKELNKTRGLVEDANEAIEDIEKFIGFVRSSPAIAFNVSPDSRRLYRILGRD